MANLLYCEFLKLKRSKMFIICILGGLVTPVMDLIMIWKQLTFTPEKPVYYHQVFEQSNLYSLLLFGIVVYVVLGAYLVSREYSENTLKAILPIPVSKVKLLLAKLITQLSLILLITLISLIGSLIACWIGGATGFSWSVILEAAREFLGGAGLLFLTLTPFIFITLWLKNIVIPVIASAVVVLANAALSGEDWAPYFPWSCPYLVIGGEVDKVPGFTPWVSIVIILAAFLLGLLACLLFLRQEDI